jgi:hypothetical protein
MGPGFRQDDTKARASASPIRRVIAHSHATDHILTGPLGTVGYLILARILLR